MHSLLSAAFGLPSFWSELTKSREEQALQSIAKYCECTFQEVLDAFSPLDENSVEHAKEKVLKKDDQAQYFRKIQLNNFRIQYLALDPKLPKERKAEIEKLKIVLKHYLKLLTAIDDFGAEQWDRLMSYEENSDRAHLFNIYACVVAETSIREKAEGQRLQQGKAGRLADQRPVFIAKRLADLFEIKGWSVTASNASNGFDPSGRFSKALANAFDALDISTHFKRPAQVARDYIRDKISE